jgi:hypothetical protein
MERIGGRFAGRPGQGLHVAVAEVLRQETVPSSDRRSNTPELHAPQTLIARKDPDPAAAKLEQQMLYRKAPPVGGAPSPARVGAATDATTRAARTRLAGA